MAKRLRIFLFVWVLVVLAGCSTVSKNPEVPTPSEGKANISGRLISVNTGNPYEGIIVRLAQVYRNSKGEGSYALDTAVSPLATTDDAGFYTFVDLDPAEYVLVIGDPMTKYQIISDSNGIAKVWKAEENSILQIGELKINFDE
jgi:hypothetical protein